MKAWPRKKERKRRLWQQGIPFIHELRKRLTCGASARQTSNIKLEKRVIWGVWEDFEELYVLPVLNFNLLLVFVAYQNE